MSDSTFKNNEELSVLTSVFNHYDDDTEMMYKDVILRASRVHKAARKADKNSHEQCKRVYIQLLKFRRSFGNFDCNARILLLELTDSKAISGRVLGDSMRGMSQLQKRAEFIETDVKSMLGFS